MHDFRHKIKTHKSPSSWSQQHLMHINTSRHTWGGMHPFCYMNNLQAWNISQIRYTMYQPLHGCYGFQVRIHVQGPDYFISQDTGTQLKKDPELDTGMWTHYINHILFNNFSIQHFLYIFTLVNVQFSLSYITSFLFYTQIRN